MTIAKIQELHDIYAAEVEAMGTGSMTAALMDRDRAIKEYEKETGKRVAWKVVPEDGTTWTKVGKNYRRIQGWDEERYTRRFKGDAYVRNATAEFIDEKTVHVEWEQAERTKTVFFEIEPLTAEQKDRLPIWNIAEDAGPEFCGDDGFEEER